MIHIKSLLLIGALTYQQQVKQAGEIRALVDSASDSVLVQRAKQQSGAVRAAMQELRAPASAGDTASERALVGARRLAAAYAVAWNDSFYVRQIARFAALSIADRRSTVAADSIALLGQGVMQHSGAEAAMRAWRESLRRYDMLLDTVGLTVSLRLLGRGFANLQQLDSAEVYYARSLSYAQRIGANIHAADALAGLSALRSIRNDLTAARSYIDQAAALHKRAGDLGGLVMDQNTLGNVLRKAGDDNGARSAYQRAFDLAMSVGDEQDAEIPLGNLAYLELDEGNPSRAATLYARALALSRKLGNRLEEANILESIGIVDQVRGDFQSAVAAYTSAGNILRVTGSSLSVSEIDVRLRSSLAHAQTGDLHGALAELARADTLVLRNKRTWRESLTLARIGLVRGDLAKGFNRYQEAERQYIRAERLASRANDMDAEIRDLAMRGLAEVYTARGDYAKARLILERTLSDTFITPGNALRSRMDIADLALKQRDTATAIRLVSQAVDSARRLSDADAETQALLQLAAYETHAHHRVEAESLSRYALRLPIRPQASIGAELHHVLADNLLARGALAEAARELEAGIAELERISSSASASEYRSDYLADKWGIYEDLALVEINRSRAAQAFEASERLRGRQMLDLLAAGHIAEGSLIGDLSTRERDLRQQIDELTQQVEKRQAAPTQLRGADASEANAELRSALDNAQRAYSALLTEMHESSPEYAALIRGETANADEVRRALAPEEALLEYLVNDSTTVAFVVTADTVVAVDLRIGRKALYDEVDFARAALSSARGSAARASWRVSMRRLHRQLIAPVEATGVLTEKRRLVIVPHGELHYLPFAALVRAAVPERLLVEDYITEYVPSASVWLRLRARTRPQQEGVLALAPQPTSLAGSATEIKGIRAIYGDKSRALVGGAASEHAFRDLAPHQRLIHIASHGVLNKRNPLFSYLALAPDADNDGRLEVHEVFGLSLNGPLVVLSACETAVGAGALSDVPPGDDWLGLVQAFLFAGASNVLGTLWSVEDATTSQLMRQFYTELASGRSPAEALALMQRAALRQPSTSDPFYWSGFTLVRGN